MLDVFDTININWFKFIAYGEIYSLVFLLIHVLVITTLNKALIRNNPV